MKSRDNEWIFRQSGSNHVMFKEDTESALLEKAKKHVSEHAGILTIFHADESHEKKMYESLVK